MPQMGESITNGTITKWHKAPGDLISIDEIFLEISTDKVESEIPSPIEGRVEQILFAEGDTVDVGILIAVIEDDISISFEGGPSASVPAKKISASEQIAAPSIREEVSVEKEIEGRRFYTPLVKKLAGDRGVALSELAKIEGSGAGGRVNKADFFAFVEGSSTGVAKKSLSPGPQIGAPVVVNPVASGAKKVDIIPMDNMRKAIAKNMIASKLTSPHVNSIDEVDMTHLVIARELLKADFQKAEGITLTYTHFVLYALVQALKAFPLVNSSIEGDNIVMKKDINLGCAVAVPGGGLVVPVIKGADNLNITGIARALHELVIKAKNKKLTMDDLSGGTYTFTNNGSFGILAATPVILQPQLGIFCVGTIKKRPIVTADLAIAIRDMMYATHTYDHRLIDGELGSKFLRFVVNTLETMNPKTLI